ncbi:hypothetical protein Tco_1333161 [Tanacetum coccineum]
MQVACNRQKSYADLKRKPMEFQVGDKVMLKVSPWKRVVHFGKWGKLNDRYVGPFKVLEKVREVAYKLKLPEELSRVHNTFHVFNLKKCYSDDPLTVPLDGLHIDDQLHFVEEPVEIMDCEVKQLKQSRIPLVKMYKLLYEELSQTLGLEVSSIRRIQVLDMAYWGFLGVGTTLDILQNILFIPYFEYGILSFSGYGLLSFIPEWSLEEVTETMAETMEQYMSKTRADYRSGVARPKIEDRDNFELKGQFLKELRTNTFSGSDHEDSNEHIEKVLKIVDLFHIPNITIDQVMLRAFPMSLTGAASRWLRNEPTGAIPSKTAADAKVTIQEMAEYSQKWHNGTSRSRSTETSDGLAAIQEQLNNLGREIKKVNEKVYASQVGCKQCKGPHYTKDFPLKEEGKPMEESYYTQFGGPFQGGGYRAAAPSFYQRNNANLSYQEQRKSMEDILSKFMSESAKRHEETPI